MAGVPGGDRSRVPEWIEPMLAKPDGGRLRSGPEWAYEYKLDGYRAAMRIAPDGTTVLTSRNGIDFTAEFASLAGVLGGGLEGRAAVLDGEIVVYNEAGQVDFGLLQERRGRYQKHRSAGRDGPFEGLPVRFLAFDLLRWGDTVLVGRPYDERRRLLTEVPMPDPYRVSVIPSVTFDQLTADRVTPSTLLERVAAEGKEGLVAKLRTAAYSPGRRPDAWLKHPLVQTQEVVVCGWRPGQNRFTGILGGLLLGAHDPDTGDLVYIGDVGTGFTEADRVALQARLEAVEIPRHPFAVAPPREDVVRARWVRPELVGEVRYRQFTRGAGRLRHTSWRGLRADREVADVIAPRSSLRDVPTARASAGIAGTADHGAGGGPAALVVESGQGAVSGGRVQQGRGDQLLLADRAAAAAASGGPSGDVHPVSRRGRRRAVLREERRAGRAAVVADGGVGQRRARGVVARRSSIR